MDRLIEAVSDIALVVEEDGTISDVHLGSPFEGEEASAWLGRSWEATVTSATRPKIRQLIDQARAEGSTRLRQVNHRLPSGNEVAVGYTALRIGQDGPVLAVGRSMQAVSDLQQKLVDAQQRMERDYWKLRQVETRYRLLFRLAGEAVLVVDPDGLQIVEANDAAAEALGVELGDLLSGPLPLDRMTDGRTALEEAFATVLEKGAAPSVPVMFGKDGHPLLAKVSLVKQEEGDAFLVHMHPRGGVRPQPTSVSQLQVSLLEAAPDGFVVTDDAGGVIHANRAFLQMAEVTSIEAAAGRSLGDWLSRPGADLTVLLSNLRRYGMVRMFPTQVVGASGSEADVELSAVRIDEGGRGYCGILVRHVGRRIEREEGGRDDLARAISEMTELLGSVSLRRLVRQTVARVEQHFIEAALELTGDNRTAASEVLGLSRQSLYTKLKRYGIQPDGAPGGSG